MESATARDSKPVNRQGIDYKKYEDNFIHALLSMNKSRAEQILRELAKKEKLLYICDNFITPAFERIGKNWECGITPLSQLYIGSHICNAILDNMLVNETLPKKKQPNLAIATLGDFHTLGKKIVIYALKTAGYKVIDFGYGLLIHDIVEKCKQKETEILLISSLMDSSALLTKQLIEALEDEGLHIKVVAGGAPFCKDKNLWKEVGAHAMGHNASDALGIIKRFEEELC
ncbi:MAG: cobalamin-dependent protein [Deltaproteobacteria bacterium]|nr:cobalamin-dependent protein [Deltaproteobacteria bacterium]